MAAKAEIIDEQIRRHAKELDKLDKMELNTRRSTKVWDNIQKNKKYHEKKIDELIQKLNQTGDQNT